MNFRWPRVDRWLPTFEKPKLARGEGGRLQYVRNSRFFSWFIYIWRKKNLSLSRLIWYNFITRELSMPDVPPTCLSWVWTCYTTRRHCNKFMMEEILPLLERAMTLEFLKSFTQQHQCAEFKTSQVWISLFVCSQHTQTKYYPGGFWCYRSHHEAFTDQFRTVSASWKAGRRLGIAPVFRVSSLGWSLGRTLGGNGIVWWEWSLLAGSFPPLHISIPDVFRSTSLPPGVYTFETECHLHRYICNQSASRAAWRAAGRSCWLRRSSVITIRFPAECVGQVLSKQLNAL